MRFEVDGALLQQFPGLAIGVVVGHNLRPAEDPERIGALLAAAEERLRQEWGGRSPQEHPRIAPWRQALQSLGLSGVKYPSSIEALARRALSGKGLPRIHPLVDLYNALSLAYRIPMGGHDLGTIAGDIRLGPTRGGEPFRAMFSEEVEVVAPGEIAYLDDADILTRHWVWRQGHKDRITPETNAIFIPIDGLPEIGLAAVQAAAEEMAGYLRAFFGAEVRSDLATAAHPVIELDLAWRLSEN
jgi:DNA/RNA-binding domain of Phe-tRNA-synthetase-like protein